MLENIAIIVELVKEYDGFSLLAIIVFYLLVDKRIQIVDKAVNQRPEGTPTISQEVSLINSKLDLMRKEALAIIKDMKLLRKEGYMRYDELKVDIKHISNEIDAHRKVDEVAFMEIAKDIKEINAKSKK